MIYTVTFSPAIDYVVYMDELKLGTTNRSKNEAYFFGGKGINVSSVLCQMGIENTAMGFVSGFTGDALEKGLQAAGVNTDFVHLENGITRINIKVKMSQETEINTQGAAITRDKMEELLKKLEQIQSDDILVVSGNVPNTLPGDTYELILRRIEGKGVKVVVDATGDLLKNVLKYKPFLIKPNKAELEDLAGSQIWNEKELAHAAQNLQSMGAVNVLVSLGGDGAYLLCETGEEYRADGIRVDVTNTVGAGDSMVAGFLAGYLEKKDYCHALKMGVAAATSTASREGLAEKRQIAFFSERTCIKKV